MPAARRLAGVLGVAAAVACGDPFGVEDVIGIWNTETIGGQALPGRVVYLGIAHDAEYARWTLYDGGVCTLTQRVNGFTETFDDCAYTVDVDGRTLVVQFRSEPWYGSVADDRMTLTDPQDVVWTLRAQ